MSCFVRIIENFPRDHFLSSLLTVSFRGSRMTLSVWNALEDKMLKEFREFAMRGNVVDMAVGYGTGEGFFEANWPLLAGVAFLLRGNLCVGVLADDVILRLDRDEVPLAERLDERRDLVIERRRRSFHVGPQTLEDGAERRRDDRPLSVCPGVSLQGGKPTGFLRLPTFQLTRLTRIAILDRSAESSAAVLRVHGTRLMRERAAGSLASLGAVRGTSVV